MGKTPNIFTGIFISTAFLWAGFVLPQFAQAESYDLYVDKSFDGEGNGSKDKPFKKIEDAVSKMKSGDKIFIKKGQYEENLTVSAKTGVYGESADSVVIKGTVTVESEAVFENLTISGGNKAIYAKENAKVTVSKSIIRDAARIGIDIVPGNGKVIVKNSKIYNNGKGFYIQSGNRFEITGSAVYKNREEGIDMRDDVDGFIQGNEIYDNGESGIEIILGDTDMVISGNSIRNNAASGIATQYYEIASNDGVLSVNNNSIKNNIGFGLRCDMPQAGAPSLDYWDRSMTLDDNVFGKNGSGNFSERCRLTLNKKEIEEIVDKEEGAEQALPQKTGLAKQQELEEAQRILEDSIKQTQERELSIEADFDALETAITGKLENLKNEHWFGYLVKGPKKEVIVEVENNLNGSREKIGEMRSVAEQAPTEEIKGNIESEIISLEQSVSNSEVILENIKKDLNFWTRLKNIF